MECLRLQNKPKAEVRPGHLLTGPTEGEGEEEEEEEEEEDVPISLLNKPTAPYRHRCENLRCHQWYALCKMCHLYQ
jgi:hypothetical protein